MSAAMPPNPSGKRIQRLKAPPAAAFAGILFAILFATSISLFRLNMPADLSGKASWSSNSYIPIQIALTLTPFAVISFLWFVGVIRDRLDEHEDQFLATVFLGSSLLFLAMVSVSMAIAGGIVVVANSGAEDSMHWGAVTFGRAVMLQISNVYALRMAAVFMISIATIWLRTRLMPQWLAVTTYILALMLLVVVSLDLWVTLIFPGWVFFISVLILFMNARTLRYRIHP